MLDQKNNTLVWQILDFALCIARMLDVASLVACNNVPLQQFNSATKT